MFNPTAAQREVSDLALTVASTKEKVIMIEAGANEVPEDRMIEAIFAAHELNQKVIAFFDTIVADPSMSPTCVVDIGPSNGISEILVAREAPSIAVSSGLQS